MDDVLSGQFSDSLSAQPTFASEFPEELAAPPSGQDGTGPSRLDADSFLDMLGYFERHQATDDRSHIIASYQAWIGRNRKWPATSPRAG